jgi:hypothetical protein
MRDSEEGTRVIPFDNLDFDAVMAQSQAACAALSDDDGGLKREVLAHAGNRWSLGILSIFSVLLVLCGTQNWRGGLMGLHSVC